MAEHLNQLSASVLIGVGAAFDFHAGLKRQAPKWMQHNGLEWFFRLMSEPRRLWRRYLVNNPAFVWMTLLQIWRARTTSDISSQNEPEEPPQHRPRAFGPASQVTAQGRVNEYQRPPIL